MMLPSYLNNFNETEGQLRNGLKNLAMAEGLTIRDDILLFSAHGIQLAVAVPDNKKTAKNSDLIYFYAARSTKTHLEAGTYRIRGKAIDEKEKLTVVDAAGRKVSDVVYIPRSPKDPKPPRPATRIVTSAHVEPVIDSVSGDVIGHRVSVDGYTFTGNYFELSFHIWYID